jgi:hypothetical protein
VVWTTFAESGGQRTAMALMDDDGGPSPAIRTGSHLCSPPFGAARHYWLREATTSGFGGQGSFLLEYRHVGMQRTLTVAAVIYYPVGINNRGYAPPHYCSTVPDKHVCIQETFRVEFVDRP